MKTFANYVDRFVRGVSGATAIEYALIAAIVSLALISGASALGVSLDGMFTEASASLD